ncbi:MAG: dienelactone hydrolase family protein [Thermoanaerobaculia bacterium]
MHRLPSTLLVVLALGCSPQSAPQAETSEETTLRAELPAPDVRGEVIKYEVDGVQLTGFMAYDEDRTGPRPGVIVVHEWWGHNEYARKRAEMLAEMGYTAFALDMYGDGKLAQHPEDAQKFMMEVTENLDVAIARFQAARELLEQHETTDPERTAAIGYCFGGAIVLHMARVGSDLDAVASFHGDLMARAKVEPGSIHARILVAHGADDPFVPVEQIEAFEQEMENVDADLTFIAYPGAVHSFTNPGATEVGQKFDMPLAHNPEADRSSWSELDRFLAETFETG